MVDHSHGGVILSLYCTLRGYFYFFVRVCDKWLISSFRTANQIAKKVTSTTRSCMVLVNFVVTWRHKFGCGQINDDIWELINRGQIINCHSDE